MKALLELIKVKKQGEEDVYRKIHRILNTVSVRTTRKFIDQDIPLENVEEMFRAIRNFVSTLDDDKKLIFLIGKSYGNTETLIKIIHGD